MSFLDTITNLFVPRDNLRAQAQQLLDRYDTDGDGSINTAALQADPYARAMLGADGNTAIAADYEGNSNGKANLKELRNHLKKFDVGSAYNPYGADDKVLDGVERLQMQMSDAQYGGFGGYGGYGGYGGMGGYGYGGVGGYGMGGFGMSGGISGGFSAGFGASGGVNGGYGGFYRGGGGPSAASQAQSGAERVA